MHVGTLFVLAGMLHGSPANAQAIDSTPPPDSARAQGPRVVLQRPLLSLLPVDDPREALTLVPGVVRRGTAFGIGAGGGLRVRGGAPDAAGVYVDGAPVRNLMTGAPGLTVAADAVDAIAVTLGPSGVEIADAAGDCGAWTGTTGGRVDCAALRQVERRFGNGDGIYDLSEQTAAFNAYYEAFFGSARFYAPGRTARVGIELTF